MAFTELIVKKNGAFDSKFIKSNKPNENHSLILTLYLNLQQLTDPSGVIADADGKRFAIKPWDGASWYFFTEKFLKLCQVWNNKFWLTPPASYSELDVRNGITTFRPNVECSLKVGIISSEAHKTIKVVRLMTFGSSVTFRSNDGLYDSLDTEKYIFHNPIPGINRLTDTPHYAIPHEIGHALGQPHIGVLKNRPSCTAVTDKNSAVCYGFNESPVVSENIMGYGLKFDSVNAIPWQNRVAEHTGTKNTDWGVSMKSLPPLQLQNETYPVDGLRQF